MERSRLVEVYSGRSALETHVAANALEEAGIRAQVVGDYLEAVAGGVPLGQAIAPRIWVAAEDEARARGILAQAQPEPDSGQGAAAAAESDEEARGEWAGEKEISPTVIEAPRLAGTSGRDISLFSGLLLLGGIVAIPGGIYLAVVSDRLLRRYPATAEAVFVSEEIRDIRVSSTMPNTLPPYRVRRMRPVTIWRQLYEYRVDGIAYPALLEREYTPDRHITIRYNPADPADHRVEPIPPPAWCALGGIVLGGFFLFFAYQFR